MRVFRIISKVLPNKLKSKILKKVIENQFDSRSNNGDKYILNFFSQTVDKIREKYELENKKYLRDFEMKLIDFISQKNKTKTKIRKVKIVYDNRFSPPTYGDLFHIIMLARLLSLMVPKVYFVVYQGRNRHDWGILDERSIKKLEQEQKQLINKLFKGNLTFKKNYLKFYIDKRSLKIKRKSLVISHYNKALHLINIITNAHQIEVPSNFYLTNHEFPINKVSPYVCMNIRKGLWSQERDTNEKLIVDDFIALRKKFPNHKIQILANADAIKEFYKVMNKSTLIKIVEPDWHKFVLAQSQFNFFEAFQLVLSCDFYFQRPNGGMVVVVLYSKVPYLGMNYGNLNFDSEKNKHFPFSSSSQIFIDNYHESDFQENLSIIFSKYEVNLK
jgi:hypothetical protein